MCRRHQSNCRRSRRPSVYGWTVRLAMLIYDKHARTYRVHLSRASRCLSVRLSVILFCLVPFLHYVSRQSIYYYSRLKPECAMSCPRCHVPSSAAVLHACIQAVLWYYYGADYRLANLALWLNGIKFGTLLIAIYPTSGWSSGILPLVLWQSLQA